MAKSQPTVVQPVQSIQLEHCWLIITQEAHPAGKLSNSSKLLKKTLEIWINAESLGKHKPDKQTLQVVVAVTVCSINRHFHVDILWSVITNSVNSQTISYFINSFT